MKQLSGCLRIERAGMGFWQQFQVSKAAELPQNINKNSQTRVLKLGLHLQALP